MYPTGSSIGKTKPEVDTYLLPVRAGCRKWPKSEKTEKYQLRGPITRSVQTGSGSKKSGTQGVPQGCYPPNRNLLAQGVPKLWHAKVDEKKIYFSSSWPRATDTQPTEGAENLRECLYIYYLSIKEVSKKSSGPKNLELSPKIGPEIIPKKRVFNAEFCGGRSLGPLTLGPKNLS
jgi:hypothetical protein